MVDFADAEMPLTPRPITATDPRAAHHASTFERLRAAVRQPEGWMVLASGAAWVFLAAGWDPQANHGAPRGFGGYVAGLGAMVIAMMLPLTIGHVRDLTAAIPPRVRIRTVPGFVAGFVAVWMLAMLAIDAAVRSTTSAAGWSTAAGAAIAAAVLWEVAPAKWRRWRRREDGPMELSPHETPGAAGSAWRGMTAGSSCAATCWALMAACVAFAHNVPMMAALFAIQLYGRYRRPPSPALTALAVLVVCLVSLAVTIGGHHHHPQI